MKRFKLTDLFVLDESQFVGDENLEYGKSYVKTFIKELNAIFGEKDNPASVAFADSWFKIDDNSIYNSKLQMYVYVKENVSRDTVEETLQELCDEYECDYQITWFQERKIEDGWKFVDFDLLLTTDKWSKNSDDSHVDISSLYLDSKKIKDNDKDLVESLVANGSVATKKEAKERVKRLNKEEKEKLGQSIKQQNKSNFYNDDKPNFEVYVDKDEWLQDPVNDEEVEALNAIVKSGWYNEEQFNNMIEKIKDYADKKFEETNSNKWYEAWYSITYYMDFDQYFNEISDDKSKVRIVDLTKDNKADRIYVGTFIVDGDKVRCIVEAFDITDALESIKDYFNAKKVEATMLYSYYDKFEWLKEHPDKAKDIIRSSNKFVDTSKNKYDDLKAAVKYHYITDISNGEDMNKFLSRVLLTYLPNEYSRQLTADEKQVVREYVKELEKSVDKNKIVDDVKDERTTNRNLLYQKKPHYTIKLNHYHLVKSWDDVRNYAGPRDSEYDKYVYDTLEEAVVDAKELFNKYKNDKIIKPNEYAFYGVQIVKWSKAGGNYVNEKDENIGIMDVYSAYDRNEIMEPLRSALRINDSTNVTDDSKKERDYSYAVVYKNDNGSYAAETYGSYKHCLDYINKPNNEAKNTYGEDNKEFRYFIVPNNGKYVPVGPVKEEKKEEVKDSNIYIPDAVDNLDIEKAAKEYIQKFKEKNDLVNIYDLINVEKVDDNTYICTFDFDAEDYTDFKDVDGDRDGFVNDLSDIGVDAIDARVENEIISDFELTNFKAELNNIKLDAADDDITNTSVSYEEESIGGYEYMGHQEFDKGSYEVLVSGVLEQFAAGKLIVEFTKK